MIALAVAFFAGALTTVNPCVLPLVPVMAASALASGRLGPFALGAGLITSFTLVGVAISVSGTFLGLDTHTLRLVSAILLIIAGIAFLIPKIETQVAAALAPAGRASASLAANVGGSGLAGQFAIGLLVGAIWTPCSGPSLGAAFALAAEADGVAVAGLRLFAFGLGAATVIGALAYGSRRMIERRRNSLATLSRVAKPLAGALFLAAGLAVLTGLDKRLETLLLDFMPDWLVALTTSV